MNIFYSFVVVNIQNHNVGKCAHDSVTLNTKHSIKMSQICIISKQLVVLKFHLMDFITTFACF